jgi:hypothetical protein
LPNGALAEWQTVDRPRPVSYDGSESQARKDVPMRPSSFFSQLCQIALHGLCIFTFVALSVPLAANDFFNKPSNEWTEAEAL